SAKGSALAAEIACAQLHPRLPANARHSPDIRVTSQPPKHIPETRTSTPRCALTAALVQVATRGIPLAVIPADTRAPPRAPNKRGLAWFRHSSWIVSVVQRIY